MIPDAYITEWRAAAPWLDDAQVEQDLVLSRAVIELFSLDELMGTKLRALYQRRKGRDLFDLWLCSERGMVDPTLVVQCFGRYMDFERHPVTRAQFEENLHEKSNDAAFLSDIKPLLATGIVYDAHAALERVKKVFIEQLHGEPWHGASGSKLGA